MIRGLANNIRLLKDSNTSYMLLKEFIDFSISILSNRHDEFEKNKKLKAIDVHLREALQLIKELEDGVCEKDKNG